APRGLLAVGPVWVVWVVWVSVIVVMAESPEQFCFLVLSTAGASEALTTADVEAPEQDLRGRGGSYARLAERRGHPLGRPGRRPGRGARHCAGPPGPPLRDRRAVSASPARAGGPARCRRRRPGRPGRCAWPRRSCPR